MAKTSEATVRLLEAQSVMDNITPQSNHSNRIAFKGKNASKVLKTNLTKDLSSKQRERG